MSKRSSAMATNGDAKKSEAASDITQPGMLLPPTEESVLLGAGCDTDCISLRPDYDKQKVLLSSATGHFSLIRALHLADLITELNGKSSSSRTVPVSAMIRPHAEAFDMCRPGSPTIRC